MCPQPQVPLLICKRADTRYRQTAVKRPREFIAVCVVDCPHFYVCSFMPFVSYARQLEKKGRMKLVYLMMQEECVLVTSYAPVGIHL